MPRGQPKKEEAVTQDTLATEAASKEVPVVTKDAFRETAKEAVAIQCKCQPEDVQEMGGDDDDYVFKYKDSVFKVLENPDFNSTSLKSWRVVVGEKPLFVYLQD